MSTNAELARIFSEMAAVLEITDSNPFRVGANYKVARILSDLTFDIRDIGSEKKKLLEIEGIGEGTASRIMEFCSTGKVKEHDALVAKIPPGLLEVTKIPGVGPKTAKLLWEQCGVVDLASLKEKIDTGALVGMPRMGEKTVANILKSIEFIEQASQRTRLGEALPLAENIIEFLQGVKGVKQIAYAGSLRRGVETVGDIDIIAAASDPKALAEKFVTMPMVQQVLGQGDTKASVRVISGGGMQVDLRVVEERAFGAALMYFTGSKSHNVRLRERAIKMGFRLNEYGLFPSGGAAGKDEDDDVAPQKRGVKPIASKTEAEIYKKLGLPFIPPELREDRGEFDRKIPALLEIDDIKAELHAHTTASDGRFRIEELAEAAKERGFHTVAVTDHSRSQVQANGLSPERLLEHIDAVRSAAAKIKGITVLAGAEVDILIDGRLDYEDELLAKLDIVVASPHASLKQDPKAATERLVRAIENRYVNILGHPTGRMIGRRDGLNLDIAAIVNAAARHDVALEINANHYRLDLRDTHVRAAVDGGALIAINCDSHSEIDMDELRYGVLTGRRGWLTAEQCINAWPKPKLHKWLRSKRP